MFDSILNDSLYIKISWQNLIRYISMWEYLSRLGLNDQFWRNSWIWTTYHHKRWMLALLIDNLKIQLLQAIGRIQVLALKRILCYGWEYHDILSHLPLIILSFFNVEAWRCQIIIIIFVNWIYKNDIWIDFIQIFKNCKIRK